MLDSAVTVVAPGDAITGIGPVANSDRPSQRATSVAKPQAPVLITEQEVMFGSAPALAPRPARISVTRRMIDSLHVVREALGDALRPPPPRPHYAHRAAYIERAAMAREMDRL
jgi:hypothetical protein